MGGVLLLKGGSALSLSYSGTVTVATVATGGKGFTIIQHGYADNAHSVTGTGFGVRNPTTVSGFTIVGIFWEYDSISNFQQTTLAVTGDSHDRTATMSIAGINQSLGLGSYDGTNTTYLSGTAQANPFGADGSTPAVVIT